MAASADERPPLTDKYGRRLAKTIKREYGVRYTQALDIVAIQYGYTNWQDAQKAFSSTDTSKWFAKRLARKEKTKKRLQLRSEQKLVLRIQEGRERFAKEGQGASPLWRYRSPIARMRMGEKWVPVDQLAATVVIFPKSDEP
ncbi:hypothetical protein [Azospirillum sp. TSH100]|uniref:hypothetical protein n=1 Tax=Azospirillum sp. TSH100 TaxID=652764 RepID=UPI0010AB377F|nr:hypothetical protein [Azospirillum sp. TSH100]QCG92350.1 hypothetical protein E6C72_31590 [Azospirillum sp. TSH100]